MFFKKIDIKLIVLLSIACILPACQTTVEKCSSKQLYEFSHQMPKPLLHVHLEGSIAPATLLDIAKQNNITMPFKDTSEFNTCCKYTSFEDFVTFFKRCIAVLKKEADYERISYEFGKECARQNIRYAEVIFSISTNCMLSGLSWQTILTALNKGRERAQKECNIQWNWIFDITRTKFFKPEELVDIIIKARDSGQGVVALGFSETLITNEPDVYKDIFEKAHRANLPIIPHAGEFQGETSIWNSLNICKAFRIDHGVRCIENQKLLYRIVQEQTPLDVCITSNVRLKVAPNYKQHPVRYLWDAGACININTDLNDEYDHLINDYHFSLDELEKVSINGISASTLKNEQKKAFIEKFKTEFALLQKKLFN
jgi:adenosine deaminase